MNNDLFGFPKRNTYSSARIYNGTSSYASGAGYTNALCFTNIGTITGNAIKCVLDTTTGSYFEVSEPGLYYTQTSYNRGSTAGDQWSIVKVPPQFSGAPLYGGGTPLDGSIANVVCSCTATSSAVSGGFQMSGMVYMHPGDRLFFISTTGNPQSFANNIWDLFKVTSES